MKLPLMANPYRSRRLTFFALAVWLGLCLLALAWGNADQDNSRLWGCSGLLAMVVVVVLAIRLKRDVKDQLGLLITYRKEAMRDPLTALGNRRALTEELARRIAQLPRGGSPVSVLLLDIDHFKRCNDTFGHQAGDEMLRSTARVLKQVVRETDLVTRYGGDEFAVVLPETSLHEANDVANRLREAMEEPICFFRGRALSSTVSIGVAVAANHEESESLLQRADQALYAAKNSGRNGGYFHDGQSTQPIAAPSQQTDP